MPENRQILIASLPTGPLTTDDFELTTADAPSAGDGEVLVRTIALTIGAGQRAGLQGSASYAGAPTTGVVMGGSGVGRVEQSNIDGIGVGDLVVGMTGWQDYAVLPARDAAFDIVDADPVLAANPLLLDEIELLLTPEDTEFLTRS